MKFTTWLLNYLYSDGFRHNYYEFLPIVINFADDRTPYNLDFLGTNLNATQLLIDNDFASGKNEFQNLHNKLIKLNDHINLEIGRLNHNFIQLKKVADIEKKYNDLQGNLKSELSVATDNLNDATKELETAHQKISAVQTELIAMLSIFAAIVLTFAGGISVIGNALSGMQKAPLLKSIFFISLCGFVLFNIIFVMMYIVGKITGRSIYARCNSSNCSCGNNGQPKCSGINRLRKRLPYVFWFNISLVLLMIISLSLWILNEIYCFIPML